MGITIDEIYAAHEGVRIETVAALVRQHDAMRAAREKSGCTDQTLRDEHLLLALAHNLCSHPDSHYGLTDPDGQPDVEDPYYACGLCRNRWDAGESRDDDDAVPAGRRVVPA